MRGFELDYRRRPGLEGWVGWFCLALGALALAWVSRETSLAEERMERLQAQVSASRRTQDPQASRTAYAASLSAEVRAAHSVYQRLSTPWSTLFAALESSQTPSVRLVSIEPDVPGRRAIIAGEAREYVAVLNYVSALETKGELRSVHLTRHEIRSKDSGFPIAFTAQVSWASDGRQSAAAAHPISREGVR